MKKNILLMLAALPLFLGCREERPISFLSEDFRTLEGERVFEDMFIGRPSRPLVIDSLLVFADDHDGKLVTVLNLKTGEYHRALDRGRGPGESIMVRRSSYDSEREEICLFDDAVKQMTFYSTEVPFSELFSVQDITRRVDLHHADVPFEAVPFSGGYISNGNFDGRYQFSLLDSICGAVSRFGAYPGDKAESGRGNAFFMKVQTIMAVNPDQSAFAAAGCNHDQLVFYRKDRSGEMRKVKEYFSLDSRVEVTVEKSGDMTRTHAAQTPETVFTYSSLYPTEDCLYASYSGLTVGEVMSAAKEGKTVGSGTRILKFDWDGNFIEGYMVGNISDFAVDEPGGYLYAFGRKDGEQVLVRYSL